MGIVLTADWLWGPRRNSGLLDTERSVASSRTAYDLGNRLQRIALPVTIQSWSLTSLQQRLFKIGARLVRHARSFRFQLAGSQLAGSLAGSHWPGAT